MKWRVKAQYGGAQIVVTLYFFQMGNDKICDLWAILLISISSVFQLTNSNQNLIQIKIYKNQTIKPKQRKWNLKQKFNAIHFANHVHTLHAHVMKLGPNWPTHKDYNDSLYLCYLLSFFHISIVCFSFYYFIVDKMFVKNI
jgi:hypothetical protein